MTQLPGPAAVPPLRSEVAHGRTLLAKDPAVLEWTGQTVRFALEPSGHVLFDVTPDQITRVRVDQGASITFTMKDGTIEHAAFPAQAAALMDSTLTPFAGAALQGTHDMMQTTPGRDWIRTLRALGVKVMDDSFAPDPRKVIKITSLIVFGIPAALAVIGFVVVLIVVAVQTYL